MKAMKSAFREMEAPICALHEEKEKRNKKIKTSLVSTLQKF